MLTTSRRGLLSANSAKPSVNITEKTAREWLQVQWLWNKKNTYGFRKCINGCVPSINYADISLAQVLQHVDAMLMTVLQ